MSDARSEAEALLERALRGDLAPDAPELIAALAEQPELRQKLAELQAVQAGLDQLGAEPATLHAEAVREVTAQDPLEIARILRQRATVRRRWRALAALAAVLFVGTGIGWGVATWRQQPTGMLSGSGSITVERTGKTIVVHIDAQLPPGERYHLRLAQDPAGPVLEDYTSDAAWTLPTPWTDAIDSCTSATLAVDIRGFGVVGTARLK